MVVEGSNGGQERVTAVLCSGGLDSAVLVAHQTRTGRVQPVYVSAGLAWETSERAIVSELLTAPAYRDVRPLAALDCPVTDTYASTHWAVRGAPPAYNTPHRDVYLVGRNTLLLAKVAVYCAVRSIGRIAVGPLAGNPFPDATPEFFAAMGHALSLGLDHAIEIVAPFAALSKEDVIRIGMELAVPWERTLSCLQPIDGQHCGRCSKCRERLEAFDAVGLRDPSSYAYRPDDVATGR